VEKKTTSRDLREKKEKEEAEQDTQNIYQNQVHMLQIGYNQQQQSNIMNNGMSSGMQNNNPVGSGFNFYNWIIKVKVDDNDKLTNKSGK